MNNVNGTGHIIRSADYPFIARVEISVDFHVRSKQFIIHAERSETYLHVKSIKGPFVVERLGSEARNMK